MADLNKSTGARSRLPRMRDSPANIDIIRTSSSLRTKRPLQHHDPGAANDAPGVRI